MNGYDARGSGILQGGGGPFRSRRKPKPTNHFPDISLGESPKTLRAHIPNFDPTLEYTERELTLLAEKILLEDDKPWDDPPVVLNASQLKYRLSHEIYVESGIPDPSIVSGYYWRLHPNGRHVRSNRKDGFYR